MVLSSRQIVALATPLVVTFDADASQAAVQAVMQNVTYESLSDDPSTAIVIALLAVEFVVSRFAKQDIVIPAPMELVLAGAAIEVVVSILAI